MSDDRTVDWGAAHWAVYERVRCFIADAADVELDKVHPTIDIFEDLGVDSLGMALIMLNLEDEYAVEEPDNIREISPDLNTPVAIVEFALTVRPEI